MATNSHAKYGIAPYRVVYYGNSQTSGTAPTDANDYYEGAPVIVLGNSGNLAKTGYVFNGWNTAQNGSGSQYAADQTFSMGTGDIRLYARWIPSGSTLPTLSTQNATNIDETSVTLNGTIIALGSPSPTAHGFCYSTNENPAIHNAICVNRGATSSTGAFSSNISGLSPSVTYYVRAYATNTAGTVYGQQVCFTTKGTYYWTGNMGNSWNNASNWNVCVPTFADKAIIPNVPNKPIICSGISAEVKNITVESGASITINQGGQFSVLDSMINNGTITVKSTAAGDGSLITNTISGSGIYNVEKYLTSNAWHLVSAPITQAYSSVFQDLWLRPYNEPTNSYGAYISPINVLLPVLQGFATWANYEQTRTFSGLINNGTVGPIALNLTGVPSENSGWNLIGNPYPSAIDWQAESGWTKTNVANSVYIWNNNQYATFVGGVGTNGGSRYIAMGQGFFVRATNSGAQISMNNNVRVHNSEGFLKYNDPANIIRLKVMTEDYSDEMIISFRMEASDEFDSDFDAYKLKGSSMAPQFYSMKNGNMMAIASYNDVNKIYGQYLFFEPASSDEHYILYSHTLENSEVPILYDQVFQQRVYPNIPYLFKTYPDDPITRFRFLEVCNTSVSNVNAVVQVWINDGKLYVFCTEDIVILKSILFNLQGEKLLETNAKVSSVSNLARGYYVVCVYTNQGIIRKKLLLC